MMIMPFFLRLFTRTLKIQHALLRNFVLVMYYAHIIIFLFSFTGTKNIKLQAMQDAPPLQLYPASDKFLM